MRNKEYDRQLLNFENKHIGIDNKFIQDVSTEEVTLLTGAGVTSCLVGNWNELLNELVVMRSCADNSIIPSKKIKDYLDRKCNGRFLSDDINTLEKGEYLRYSVKDERIYESKERRGNWREIVFASRVLAAVKRLIHRHLFDGAGIHLVEDEKHNDDYKKDFMNWCHNTEETPFHLKRRTLCNNKETEEEIAKYNVTEIENRLNSWFSVTINNSKIQKAIENKEDVAKLIFDMMSTLYGGDSGSFLGCIQNYVKHKDLEGKSPLDKTKLILQKIAAYLLWRPSYDTLEVLLSMCINRKVKRVITYNFDTIFDRLLVDKDVQELLSKEKKSDLKVAVYGIRSSDPYDWEGFEVSDSPDTIQIFHVHGIVDDEMKELEPVIFSETSYLSYQQVALNQGSMHVANAYNSGTLLCVGFSGSDPNFRSIVRQLIRQKNTPVFFDPEKKKVWLTRSLEDVEKYYKVNEDMLSSDYDVAFQCCDIYIDLIEHYYDHQIDMKILWAKDYLEMSKNFREVFKLPIVNKAEV